MNALPFARNSSCAPSCKDNVAEIAAAGRARWKIENEGFNVLKTKGYNLEHNFGHGIQNLADLPVCCSAGWSLASSSGRILIRPPATWFISKCGLPGTGRPTGWWISPFSWSGWMWFGLPC